MGYLLKLSFLMSVAALAEPPNHQIEVQGETSAPAVVSLGRPNSKDPFEGRSFYFDKLDIKCDGKEVPPWRNVTVFYKANTADRGIKCTGKNEARVNRLLGDGTFDTQTCCARESIFDALRPKNKAQETTAEHSAVPVSPAPQVSSAQVLPPEVPASATEDVRAELPQAAAVPPEGGKTPEGWAESMAERLAEDPKNKNKVDYKTFLKALQAFEFFKNKGKILLPKAHISKKYAKEGKTIRQVEIRRPDRMLFVNYDQSSDQPRLYAINLVEGKIHAVYKMGHGEGKDGDGIPENSRAKAEHFSNDIGSELPSYGAFLTADVFDGKHGQSVGLIGLQKGINDNSYTRGMWLHAEDDYVLPGNAVCGRSNGCIAVMSSAMKELASYVGTHSEGVTFLYAHKTNPKTH